MDLKSIIGGIFTLLTEEEIALVRARIAERMEEAVNTKPDETTQLYRSHGTIQRTWTHKPAAVLAIQYLGGVRNKQRVMGFLNEHGAPFISSQEGRIILMEPGNPTSHVQLSEGDFVVVQPVNGGITVQLLSEKVFQENFGLESEAWMAPRSSEKSEDLDSDVHEFPDTFEDDGPYGETEHQDKG